MTRALGTVARLVAVAVGRATAACVGIAAVAAFGFGAQDVLLTTRSAHAAGNVRISGDVGGLVPGGPARSLTLTLRNTGDDVATVTTVTTTPTGTSGPRTCAATYLSVGEWHGTLTVAAGEVERVTVPARLAAATPTECAAVTWGLAYSAQ